jgi:hypothetical protein
VLTYGEKPLPFDNPRESAHFIDVAVEPRCLDWIVYRIWALK